MTDITEGLDLLGDWLDAKGYTEEAGLCTRAMDFIHKQGDEIALLKQETAELKRAVKTAVFADSAELKDCKAENARLREEIKLLKRDTAYHCD